MKYKFLLIAAALLLPVFAGAQNGVNYTYTHTDGVEYSCSVYTDSIIISAADPGTVTDVVIPDSIAWGGVSRPVREIGASAFSYTDVESVVIPNTVTEIGYGAFSGCSYLETVTVGTAVRTIWETAFSTCESMVTLNYNAINASMYAFSGSGALDDCDALETINIGSEVQSLPEDLVGSVFPLVSLANVNIAAERLLTISSGYFGSSVSGLAIQVPCSQLSAYQGNAVWNALGTITADCDSSAQDTTSSDTTHVVVYDTVVYYDTVVRYDTVTYYDTVVRYTDSVYCDTLYVYDTVYLHDTIYLDPQTGADPVEAAPVKVYVEGGNIVIEGAEPGETVMLYDISGRPLAQLRATAGRTTIAAPASGTLLLRVGQRPARKLVMIN